MDSVWVPQGHWSSYEYSSGLHKAQSFLCLWDSISAFQAKKLGVEKHFCSWRTQPQGESSGGNFEELLNLKELREWEAFKSVCSGFLGNTRTRLASLYWEVAKVLRGYGVPNVTQDSFSPFPPQILPDKPWSSEWWAWRKIPPRHYEYGEQLSRQMEPRHDERLLLDALAWHPGGKIHQIF